MAKASHTAREHAVKMCALTCCPHDLPMKKIKSLTRGAQFVCKSCGHAAADAKNLCKPEAIG